MIIRRKYVLMLWLCMAGLLCLQMPVFSQETSDIVIGGAFGRTAEHQWSSDNSQFTFYNYDLGTSGNPLRVTTESAGWQSIDVATGTLSEGMNTWALQPTLTEAEQTAFMSVGFVHQSPDNNLLIFAQNPPDMGYFQLVIANRSTGQVTSLNLESTSYPFSPNNFDVQWSADNHVSVIAYRSGFGAWRVFHIDIPDFNDLLNSTIREFVTLVDGVPYTTTPAIEDGLLDLSTDGQHVLLIARDSTLNETTSFYLKSPKLVIWNPYTDFVSISSPNFTIQQFLRGSFAPDFDGRLILANQHGLFIHNHITNQTELIRNDPEILNARYFFSPNGEWLTVVRDNDIRFVSISDALSQDE